MAFNSYRGSNNLDITFSVTPDERRNQRAIDLAVEQIRKALNKDFDFNIEAGNVDEVIKQLEQIGVRLNAIKNDKGFITALSTSFNNVNGTVVTLNTSIQSSIKSLQELKREAEKAGEPIPTKASLYRTGKAVDSNGEIVTDWNKRGNIVGLLNQHTLTQTSYAKEEDTVITKLIEKYKILNKEQSKMGTVGWTEEVAKRVQDLRDKIDQLKKETQEYLKSNNLEDTEYGSQIKRTIDRNEYASMTKVYQEQLKTIDQIREKELQLIQANSEQKVVLEQQLVKLREKQAILEKLPISEDQEKAVKAYKEQSSELQKNVEEIRKNNQETQNYISTLKELSSVEGQLLKADKNDTETIEYLKKRREELIEIVKNTKEEARSTEEAKKALASYNEELKKTDAQTKDKEDSKLIQEVIEARKEQYKIEENLHRLINNKATPEAINEERNAYLAARDAADRLEKSQLNQGETVARNSRYIKENNALLEKHEQILRLNDASVKDITKSWMSFFSSFKNRMLNTIQYVFSFDVAFNGIRQTITKTIGEIKELNDAMTQVRLVTGQTNQEAVETISTYAQLAKQMGDTTKNVAAGSVEWLHMSRSL